MIDEKPYANWADSIPKRGKVLYTNVLYWKSIVALEELSGKLKIKDKLDVNSRFIKSEIDRSFWNGRYFRDVDNGARFATDGNVLAVVFGLASRLQKEKILMK